MDPKVQEILKFWFGRVEETILPTQNRSKIWFGGGKELDDQIRERFGDDLDKAILGEYDHWDKDPRGSLALIIILDQFSRNIHRDMPMAYTQDQKALDVCVRGIERQYDHEVSLIERSFFYMPFMHSENLEMQTTSLRAFKMLVDLSFPEGRPIFENFYKYAISHYKVIERYGRFPSRNKVLGRDCAPDEIEYLKNIGDNPWG